MKEAYYPQPEPRETHREISDPADPATWNALFARLRKLERRVSELEGREKV
jgi:hypothetical protein